MPKLFCFSRSDARNFYEETGWTSDSIPQDVAIISIAGTPECQEYYIRDKENHWFTESPSVLNLNFDDLSTDEKIWRGHVFKGLSIIDAERAVKFIKENIGRSFYINCRAGKSRSQAFVRYILDYYPEINYETNPDNPPLTPNVDVLAKLKKAHRDCYLDIIIDLERNGFMVVSSITYPNGIILQLNNEKVYYYDNAKPYSLDILEEFNSVSECMDWVNRRY